MKIVRDFLYTCDEDFGMGGMVPLWIPKAAGFNVSDPRGMVHDMLEHRLCDSGHFHEELMAYGRITALRVEPGILTNLYESGGLHKSLGTELGSAWVNAQDEDIPPAPRVAPIPEFDEELKEIMQGMARELYSEGSQACRSKEQMNRAANWIKLGYLDAKRRYGPRIDQIGWAAFEWAASKEAARLIDRVKQDSFDYDTTVLRLTFDTSVLRMSSAVFSPHPDEWGYVRQAPWVRRRINAWRRGERSRLPSEFA